MDREERGRMGMESRIPENKFVEVLVEEARKMAREQELEGAASAD